MTTSVQVPTLVMVEDCWYLGSFDTSKSVTLKSLIDGTKALFASAPETMSVVAEVEDRYITIDSDDVS